VGANPLVPNSYYWQGQRQGGKAGVGPPRHFKYTNAERLRTAKPIIIHKKKKDQCKIQCTMELQHRFV